MLLHFFSQKFFFSSEDKIIDGVFSWGLSCEGSNLLFSFDVHSLPSRRDINVDADDVISVAIKSLTTTTTTAAAAAASTTTISVWRSTKVSGGLLVAQIVFIAP